MRRTTAGRRDFIPFFSLAFLAQLFFLSTMVFARDAASARDTFQDATDREKALGETSADRRTRQEYQNIILLYQQVVRENPAFAKCPEALWRMALLSREAARLFTAPALAEKAVTYLDWLMREYPHAPHRVSALKLKGDIYAEDLAQTNRAREVYEEIIRRYPGAKVVPEVVKKLNELDTQPAPTPITTAAKPGRGGSGPATKPTTRKESGTKESNPTAGPDTARPNPNVSSAPASEVLVPPKAAGMNQAGPAADSQSVTTKLTEPQASPIVPTAPAQLVNVRFWSTTDYTRVIMDFDREVPFKHQELDNPYRIFFDFDNTVLSPTVKGKTFSVGDSYLFGVRVGLNQKNVARVVLDFKKKGSCTIFNLYEPFRVVIDIRDTMKDKLAQERRQKLAQVFQERARQTVAPPAAPETGTNPPKEAQGLVKPSEKAPPAKPIEAPSSKKAEAPTGKKSAESTEKKTGTPSEKKTEVAPDKKAEPMPEKKAETRPVRHPEPPPVSKTEPADQEKTEEVTATPPAAGQGDKSTLTRILGMKVGKIVIDPGHGGRDSGSTGYHKIKEKDITLSIAQQLQKQVETRLGIEAFLTRADDVSLPLEQRTAIVNMENADLFISIHANSSRNSKVGGFETYYLGLTTDRRAQAIAAYENAASQQNLGQLENVIKKITLYEKINESRDFATKVQNKLCKIVGSQERNARNRGVKKAPFVVLIGAEVPSILVEIGFISNQNEADFISNPKNQELIAKAIAEGIEDYLANLGTLTHAVAPHRSKTGTVKMP